MKIILTCFVHCNFGGGVKNPVKFVHCSNVLAVILIFESIEQPVCSILGMANNKKDEVDLLEVPTLNEIRNKPKN